MALVSLAEYAQIHGRDPATVRQKVLRGGFTSARKIGGRWVINSDEPYEDLRQKKENEVEGIFMGGRTREEITRAVLAACGGSFTDSDQEIASIQYDLIGALCWVECPPANGWQYEAIRQLKELNQLPACEETQRIIKSVGRASMSKRPWDIEAVDKYIEDAQSSMKCATD